MLKWFNNNVNFQEVFDPLKSITRRAQACLPENVLGQRSDINDCLFKLSLSLRLGVGVWGLPFVSINDPTLFS